MGINKKRGFSFSFLLNVKVTDMERGGEDLNNLSTFSGAIAVCRYIDF